MSEFFIWVSSVIAAIFPAFAPDDELAFNGYVEADYVYASAATFGRIEAINVSDGDEITKGQILFQLDTAHQIAAEKSAIAQVEVARANLENLLTGRRSEEIAVIAAALDQARSEQNLAQTSAARADQLVSSGSLSKARLDEINAKLQSANAQVAKLEAELMVAKLPARDAQRIAAEATLATAQAKAIDAQTALADRKVYAPIAGRIDKVYFEPGEVVPTAAPVVSIIPNDALKALFFVPEAERASIEIGQKFALSCSGCAGGITAIVTRMNAQPQYTPPIIYSQEQRSRLVYLTEARINASSALLPGQPITLRPMK